MKTIMTGFGLACTLCLGSTFADVNVGTLATTVSNSAAADTASGRATGGAAADTASMSMNARFRRTSASAALHAPFNPDMNGDGKLDVSDFTTFHSLVMQGDVRANCDGSRVPPVVNVADFGCFLQKFAAAQATGATVPNDVLAMDTAPTGSTTPDDDQAADTAPVTPVGPGVPQILQAGQNLSSGE